ncbi:MAG: glycoside hydrolase family 88 protein [Tenericutes bacterium]|nr:glycoside hydrolase family 88 protein [Mycoplasmatota bacterium]
MLDKTYFDKVIELADYIKNTWDPKMKWMWGEALFGYALSLLDEHLNEDRYTNFLTQYCDYYVSNPPRVDQSDTSAPALITYAMYKKTGNEDYKKLTDRVLYYIKNEPRLIEDSVNHLGNSLEGKFYPKSIWVDSLMMFSVFPSLYAKENYDQVMMDIASRQPRVMAKYMQDPEDKLWYHSYWTKQKTHYPKRKLYWGRGNGWVIASLPMILENIGDHEERDNIIQIFKETAYALLPYQREDGAFETVFNKVGKTYRELSFTALVAAGFMHGYNLGILSEVYLEAGLKAYQCVVDALIYDKDDIYMPEVSGPTIPLPLFPYIGYKIIPRGKNWSFGLAALIFAAIQFDKIKK